MFTSLQDHISDLVMDLFFTTAHPMLAAPHHTLHKIISYIPTSFKTSLSTTIPPPTEVNRLPATTEVDEEKDDRSILYQFILQPTTITFHTSRFLISQPRPTTTAEIPLPHLPGPSYTLARNVSNPRQKGTNNVKTGQIHPTNHIHIPSNSSETPPSTQHALTP